MSDDRNRHAPQDSIFTSIISAEQKDALMKMGVDDGVIALLPHIPKFSWNRFIWEMRLFRVQENENREKSRELAEKQINQELMEKHCIIFKSDTRKEDLEKNPNRISQKQYDAMVQQLMIRHQDHKFNMVLGRYVVDGIAIHRTQYDRTQRDVALFTITDDDAVDVV